MPTEAEIDAAAMRICQEMADGSDEWVASYWSWATQQPHRGDCPKAEHKGPITCDACVVEEARAEARRRVN